MDLLLVNAKIMCYDSTDARQALKSPPGTGAGF